MLDHDRQFDHPSEPGQALAGDYGTFSTAAKVRLVCLLRANGQRPLKNLQMCLFLNEIFLSLGYGKFGDSFP